MEQADEIALLERRFGVKAESYSSYYEDDDGEIVNFWTTIVPIGKSGEPNTFRGERFVFRLFEPRTSSRYSYSTEFALAGIIPGYNDSYDENFTSHLRLKLDKLKGQRRLGTAFTLTYYCGKVELEVVIFEKLVFAGGRLDESVLQDILRDYMSSWKMYLSAIGR